MKNTNLYNNYEFLAVDFKKYHHTDNRKGSPFNFLALLLKGSARIVSPNKTLYINEGDVFFIPSHLSYESYWYGEDIKFISLGYTKLENGISSAFNLQKLFPQRELIQKMLSIPTVAIDSTPVNSFLQNSTASCRALSIFYDIMADVIPMLSASGESGASLLLEKIKSTIALNPYASISQIARECSISEPYLYKLFKRYEDVSPNDYKNKIICNMAVEQLTTTNKKIEDIAGEMNFSSASYFRKMLKKHLGLTPRELRKSNSLIL